MRVIKVYRVLSFGVGLLVVSLNTRTPLANVWSFRGTVQCHLNRETEIVMNCVKGRKNQMLCCSWTIPSRVKRPQSLHLFRGLFPG